MAKTYKIHPSIGIARVGDSPEMFLGPERPLTFAQASDGKYRDAQKRLRRQGVRFWIVEHDDDGAEPGRFMFEEAADVERIEWSVHLANKKAVWFEFDTIRGITGDPTQGVAYPPDWPLRNEGFIPASRPEERAQRLVIDPGPRTLSGANQRVEIEKGNGAVAERWPGPFVDGREITSLGTMMTDDKGRLIVAGGFGVAGAVEPDAVPPDGRLPSFVNNDKWFDDVSDGSVTARIVFKDGREQEVAGAWLIVGPPDYAPPISHLVTMYDVMLDLAVRVHGARPDVFDVAASRFRDNYRPSYTDDVYPILRRAFDYRWVIAQAVRHGTLVFDFDALGAAAGEDEDPADNPRFQIFDRLRDPADLNGPPTRSMPRLHNDGTDGVEPETLRLTLTRTQYEIMRRWAEGQFKADWVGPPTAPTVVTPDGLDRAALEGGCGGGFFPGIEAGWILRNPAIYGEPFRFRQLSVEDNATGVTPGDVTKQSALPWQADFLKCGNNWWPAQRPNQVRPNATATTGVEWARDIVGHVDLVERWSRLGIVTASTTPGSPALFHESERELP